MPSIETYLARIGSIWKKLVSVHPYCFPTTDQIDREASDGWLHLIASLAPVACTLPINFSRRVSAFSRLAEFAYSLSPVCCKFRYECEFFSGVWPNVNDLVREGIRQSLENRSRKWKVTRATCVNTLESQTRQHEHVWETETGLYLGKK